jgi:hypothetical protein
VNPKHIYRGLQRRYYSLRSALALRRFDNTRPLAPYKGIPIVINNRNRVTFLKRLIESLLCRGYENIFILDNASTFPPLLEYYQTCPCQIVRLDKNLGHLALWRSELIAGLISDFYVYTDPDLELVPECPTDFLNTMRAGLLRYPRLHKIGVSLATHDLPAHYARRDEVIAWEAGLRGEKIDDVFYCANVDTTFALYRPFCTGGAHLFKPAARAEFPIMARHLPWYSDTSALSIEEQFYIDHAKTSTFWTSGHSRA